MLSDALFSTWNVVEPSAGVFAGDRYFVFPASSAMKSALDSPGSRFSVGRQLYCRLKGSIQLITRHRVLNIEDPPHLRPLGLRKRICTGALHCHRRGRLCRPKDAP